MLVVVWNVFRYGALVILLLVFFSHAVVRSTAEGRILVESEDIPSDSFLLLLGTSRYTRTGQPNEFFVHRIDAAVELLETGRVSKVIASGGASDPGYNEPRSMYNALLQRGVSPDLIVLDPGGVRTLDSVYRMETVFTRDEFVIVSQRFHLERALFFAAHRGMSATGYVARDATGFLNLHIRLREYLARVRAVLDVYIFGTEPRVPAGFQVIEYPAD